ncbi:hypothetical protein GCM10009827_004370 [Dactylosporangium maewongense]|uniref:Uncharacterized protein n=1 Tax=Dactylosporangium maewongense TaxID=634393 RepID=A0ABN1ZJB7_9ACTN
MYRTAGVVAADGMLLLVAVLSVLLGNGAVVALRDGTFAETGQVPRC